MTTNYFRKIITIFFTSEKEVKRPILKIDPKLRIIFLINKINATLQILIQI